MNMLLHGVKDSEFDIFHCDIQLNEWDMMREPNPAKKPGLAPKFAAAFAFLLHGSRFLKDEGVMAIILPHGVLFRGGAEERIRTKLLNDGYIDTVIGPDGFDKGKLQDQLSKQHQDHPRAVALSRRGTDWNGILGSRCSW
jgi:hypothetical protein